MTMPRSERELVVMLRERTENPPAAPERGERAAALGQRILRRRRAVRASLATGAVAALIGAALALPDGKDDPIPAEAVPVSVRLPAKVPLPAKAGHLFRNENLPLIQSEQHDRMGEPVRLRFTALSTDTIYNVRCSVPDSWLVVKTDSPGRAADIGRCGPRDHLAQFDPQSAGTAWAGRPHTWELWVLPPEAEINGTTDPEKIDKVAARTGTRPGTWAVGIYDRRK
ncbi:MULTISPECIES: hypothetical protein [Actinomadura]|uniref:Uncharacterized protein n=1 Tax=Actinomadura yumaensis TaxID=111807 RepID=A0ABW2CTA6_9ACTN|nr:hypothetical protein [Actinomadura sp. J1-007]MWK35306.1 hypothetical protein [Actinomadura sp. J1-007]